MERESLATGVRRRLAAALRACAARFEPRAGAAAEAPPMPEAGGPPAHWLADLARARRRGAVEGNGERDAGEALPTVHAPKEVDRDPISADEPRPQPSPTAADSEPQHAPGADTVTPARPAPSTGQLPPSAPSGERRVRVREHRQTPFDAVRETTATSPRSTSPSVEVDAAERSKPRSADAAAGTQGIPPSERRAPAAAARGNPAIAAPEAVRRVPSATASEGASPAPARTPSADSMPRVDAIRGGSPLSAPLRNPPTETPPANLRAKPLLRPRADSAPTPTSVPRAVPPTAPPPGQPRIVRAPTPPLPLTIEPQAERSSAELAVAPKSPAADRRERTTEQQRSRRHPSLAAHSVGRSVLQPAIPPPFVAPGPWQLSAPQRRGAELPAQLSPAQASPAHPTPQPTAGANCAADEPTDPWPTLRPLGRRGFAAGWDGAGPGSLDPAPVPTEPSAADWLRGEREREAELAREQRGTPWNG
jgi:hypothetical protein